MKNEGEPQLFAGLVAQIGKEWEENYTAEEIRMDEGKLDLLLAVQKQAMQPGATLSIAQIHELAPSFCSVFEAVTLRKIEELNFDGSADSG